MIKYAIVLMLIISLKSDEAPLMWRDNPAIQWTDFRGAVNNSSPFDAQVYSGMKYSLSYSVVDDKVNVDFEIHSFFDPRKSWIKRGKQTEELLNHEQLHFDISELYARKLRKALLQHEFSLSPEKDFEMIFSELNEERKNLQRQYDVETRHSKNKIEQQRWDHFIKRQLAQYSDYN